MFDVDRTPLAPARCSQRLIFHESELYNLYWQREHFLLTFCLIKRLLQDLVLGAHNNGEYLAWAPMWRILHQILYQQPL